jgi:hypothetical protein
MTALRSMLYVIAIASLAIACGESSDPNDNVDGAGGTGGSGAVGAGGAGGMGGLMATGGTGGSAGAAGGTMAAGGTGGTGGTGGGAGVGGGAGGGAGGTGGGAGGALGVCPNEISFLGQTVGMGADVPDGGNAIFTPYPAEYTAGIADVQSAIPEMHGEEATVDLMVTGATVVATGYRSMHDIPQSQTIFWVADADGTIQVRLYHDDITADEVAPFAIQVGQRISFRATQVSRYYAQSQIQRATDWVLVDTDQDVALWDPDRELTEADVHRIVRITGTLEGEPSGCGGDSRCWNLGYGHGAPGVFRTRSTIVDTGSCVTFVGPLGWFQSDPQFNVDNYSWLKVY